MIEQSRFLSTVFLCSEFKLGSIYSGVNSCGKNISGDVYLQKLAPAKISCHTVVRKRPLYIGTLSLAFYLLVFGLFVVLFAVVSVCVGG